MIKEADEPLTGNGPPPSKRFTTFPFKYLQQESILGGKNDKFNNRVK